MSEEQAKYGTRVLTRKHRKLLDKLDQLEQDKTMLTILQGRYKPHGDSGISTRMYWTVTHTLMALDVEIGSIQRELR